MNSAPATSLPRLLGQRPGGMHQRGLALVGVITLMMALLFSTLAIDTARLWLQKRNLQKAADMAAMAAARFTGCGSRQADALTAAKAAAGLNAPDTTSDSSGATTLLVQRGRVGLGTTLQTAFTVDETENNNAAHVELSKPVRASLLMGGLFNQTVTMKAQATAQGGPPIGTFSVGSLVGVDEKQAKFVTSLFRAILGNSSLNLGVGALTDLAATSVSLAQLQVLAGAQTIDQLLNMQVPLNQLLQWIATASPSSAAANAAMSQLISASASSGLQVKLRDVLEVHLPSDTATASARINVLDLINVGIMVGKGNSLINMDLGITGIGKVSLGLGAVPKIGIGPAGKSNSGAWCTEAQSAQVELVVGVNPLGIGLVDMALRVQVAAVKGQLASLNVSPGATTGVVNATSTIIGLSLTKNADASKPASVLAGLVTVGLNLPLLEASGGSASFTVASRNNLPTPVKTAATVGQSIGGLLGDTANLKIKVLGLSLIDPVVLLKPVVDLLAGIVEALVTPLLNLLGLNAGLVEVQLMDVSTSLPVLRE